MDWPLIAYFLLGFSVLMYTVMDGFDLGIGIMLPWQRDTALRDQMIQSIAPVWDGNETWLVLGGVLLLSGFPLAFATLLPALYVPVMLMLFGLIFRGVAFEFRFKTQRGRMAWDVAFSGGSALAAFAQGLMLASLIGGDFPPGLATTVGPDYGSIRLSIFSLFAALGLMSGYGLLGLTWLHWRGDDALRAWAGKAGRRCLIGVALFLLLVSVWTPLLHPDISERWFSWPLLLLLAPIPLATAWLLWRVFRGLLNAERRAPFIATIAVFVLGFAGLVVSLFPWLVPGQLTLWQAAGHDTSLRIMLIGVLVLLPMILAYTFWSYRVFRGAIDQGYH